LFLAVIFTESGTLWCTVHEKAYNFHTLHYVHADFTGNSNAHCHKNKLFLWGSNKKAMGILQ
jgi:hypothetical protein